MLSIRHLYNGTSISWDDYKEHKASSVKWSAAMAITFPGGPILSTLASTGKAQLFKAIGKKVLLELGKAAGKALALDFIEGNIMSGIESNVFGINTVLDQAFKSSYVDDEWTKFKTYGMNLYAVSWEEKQAEDILSSVLTSALYEGRGTVFEVQLEEVWSDVRFSLLSGMTKKLVKSTLPISNPNLEGDYGSDHKKIAECSTPIEALLLATMRNINDKLARKVEKLDGLKGELTLLDIETCGRSPEEQYAAFLDQSKLGCEKKMRMMIVGHFYKQLTGTKMKQTLHETIRSGYKVILNGSKFSVQDIVDEYQESPEVDEKEEKQAEQKR